MSNSACKVSITRSPVQVRAERWSYPDECPTVELLWVQLNATVRQTLIGAVYHPPKPKYKPSTLLDLIAENVSAIRHLFPSALVVLAGDFNRLPNDEIVTRTSMQQIVQRPTCGSRILDKIFVSEPSSYSTVEVIEPRMNTDHKAVVAE